MGFAARRPRASRVHPARALALLCLVVGLILLVSFGASVWQGVHTQQQLNQQWQTQVGPNPPNLRVVDPSLKRPLHGVDFAIHVPKLHYFAAVKEGTDANTLYDSPGHYPQTPWPGDPGMVGVAAHNVFWINFPRLARGDEVEIDTRYGTFRYRVTGARIVNPNDRTVLIPDADGYHLTLTTCWPLWAGAFATQRYVIFTDQYWPAPQRRPVA
jgi:sortase A